MTVVLEQFAHANSQTDTVNPPVATLGSAPTAGNLLVVVYGGRMEDGTVGTFTASGSGGETVTEVGQTTPMEAHTVYIGFRVVQAGDPVGWTVASSESARKFVSVAEFSGVTDPVVDASSFNGSGATNAASIATGSTGALSTATDALAVVAGTSRTNNAGLTVSGTHGVITGSTDCSSYNIIAEWFAPASTAALDETVSESSGNSRMGAGIVVFVPAGGGGDTFTATLDATTDDTVADLNATATQPAFTASLDAVTEDATADLNATVVNPTTPITTDFEGATLPDGWTIASPVGGETITVSDSRLHITLPVDVAYDSVFNTSSADNSAGIEHAIVTADVDVAVQFDTDVSNTQGFGVGVLVKGATEADIARCSFYGPSGTGLNPLIFGYQRSGGAGGTSGNTNFADSNTYAHPWMRVAYDSATGTWTYYSSKDGAAWVQQQQRIQAFTPTRLKISMTSSTPLPGGTTRVNKVVDLLAAGTTDVRDAVPALVPTTVFSLDGSAGALPAELTDDSANSGSITFTGTAMRMTQDRDVNGSRARVIYSGSSVTDGGVLALVTHLVSNINAFLALGIGRDTGNPSDQYSRGPGYIHESTGSTLRRAMRIDPNDLSADGKAGFEAPYGFLAIPTDTALFAVPTWIRVEKVGRRIRMRDWPDGSAEPSTWRFDGQDEVQDGPYGLVLGYSHNDGTTGGTTSLDVTSVEVYELAADTGNRVAMLDATTADAVADLNATHVAPTFTATLDAVTEGATSDLNATSTAPVFTAELDAVTDDATADLNATHDPPTFTATLDVATEDTVADLNATTGVPEFTATLDAVTDDAIADLNATTTAPVFTAELDAATADTTSDLNATFVAPGVFTATLGAATEDAVADLNATVVNPPPPVGQLNIEVTFLSPVFRSRVPSLEMVTRTGAGAVTVGRATEVAQVGRDAEVAQVERDAEVAIQARSAEGRFRTRSTTIQAVTRTPGSAEF